MSSKTSAPGLVRLLNYMFEVFDQLAGMNGVEKVKTIGDCYFAATGLPEPNPDHAKAMTRYDTNSMSWNEFYYDMYTYLKFHWEKPRIITCKPSPRFGLQMLQRVKNIYNDETKQQVRMRLGIHSSKVLAGIIGVEKYVYGEEPIIVKSSLSYSY
jgi:class 3 adenylate cyclase